MANKIVEGTFQAWSHRVGEQCGPVVVPHRNYHGLSFPGMLEGPGQLGGGNRVSHAGERREDIDMFRFTILTAG